MPVKVVVCKEGGGKMWKISVRNMKYMNIYCVVAHKSEEGLVQVGGTLKMGTLGFSILIDRSCFCGGDPVVEESTVPTHQGH